MKKIILSFLVYLSIAYSYAQTNARDSLKQLLQKEKTDTGRALLLNKLSFEYFESKPDTAMSLALEALSLAQQEGFEKGKAESLNRIAIAYDVFGNYPKAMELLLEALQINEKINNLEGIRRNYNNIGNLYIEQEDYQQGLDYYLKAKSLAESSNDKKSLSLTYVNIAEAYFFLKIFDSARSYANRANDVAVEIDYPRIIGTSLSSLGNIHFLREQNTLALEYHRLSIPYLRISENYVRLSETFLDIAKVFQKVGQKDSALSYARRSLLLAKETGFTKLVRDAGRFLSAYYRNMRIQDSAYFYQDVTKAANDSLFNQQKTRQLLSLAFDEKLRQQEITASELKTEEERKNNLQHAAIVVGLISFILLFFILSRSIIVKEKFIKFFGIVGLLAVFEFINLYIHPYLGEITNHSPFWMLAILICIGALLVPLHHKLEKWITKIMVEKNKKIRLEAARKTIATLEPSFANLSSKALGKDEASGGEGKQTN
ncbi:MAG TPA: tetratricopeptide repeat protein [Ferruginibacter sp.]|nr:tetratricopeptide repeat protein [Ferruginibacter sp.]